MASEVEIKIVEREGGPERLVAEAEIVFTSGLLEGMKLVGFSLWKSPEGEECYVTFPSRGFGAGADRRYFDFLRMQEPGLTGGRRVKAAIIDAYHRHAGSAAAPVTAEGEAPAEGWVAR